MGGWLFFSIYSVYIMFHYIEASVFLLTLNTFQGGRVKVLKLSYLCCIVAFTLQMAWAQMDFVLQNGSNGYDGCVDAYVKSSVSSNQGNSATLESSYYYCSS